MRYKTVVVGSGRLGANIARHLSNQKESVDIIDSDPTAFRKIADDFSGNKIIGDGSETSTLDQSDISNAERIVIVTGDDNANIYIAHLALSIYNIPRIYVRLFDVTKGKLIEGTRIKPIYPFNLSLDAFLDLEGDNKK